MFNFNSRHAFVGKTLIFSVAVALTTPSFAASTCDSLVGEFSKKADGAAWLKIDRKDAAYTASTFGPLLGGGEKTPRWNEEPATPLDLIPAAKLADFAKSNGNKPSIEGMCGLAGGRIVILKVPVGYRYGEGPEDVSKTGYVMAVYAGEYGFGTTELYPAKDKPALPRDQVPSAQ